MNDYCEIPIGEIAEKLGIKVKGKSARCYNKSAHKSGDLHPSLVFYPNSYKCMACGVNGNSIELIKEVTNCDFQEALNWIKYNFPSPGKYCNKIDNTRSVSNKDIQIYNDFISLCELDQQHLDYLQSRGLSNLSLEYGVTSVTKHIGKELRKLYKIEDLIHSGLYSTNRNNKPYFTFFNHTLIFPFRYYESVYFIQGRTIRKDIKPKYRNLSKEILYPYNVNILTHPDIWGEDILIAEGCIDTLSLLEKSYNAVGIIGAHNFKKGWVRLFTEYEVNPIIALDNDATGIIGAKKIMEHFNKNLTRVELAAGDWNDSICD